MASPAIAAGPQVRARTRGPDFQKRPSNSTARAWRLARRADAATCRAWGAPAQGPRRARLRGAPPPQGTGGGGKVQEGTSPHSDCVRAPHGMRPMHALAPFIAPRPQALPMPATQYFYIALNISHSYTRIILLYYLSDCVVAVWSCTACYLPSPGSVL
jgi:hypothetical protein